MPAESHHSFHIYSDEAHQFLTDALEDLLVETRKFNVSLTLAHQYMRQFPTDKEGAMSGTGTTVIFQVGHRDAGYLVKDLQSKVKCDDLITLRVGQAIARIDNEIVRVRTQPPLAAAPDNCRDQIIDRSRQRYCQPVGQVKAIVRRLYDQSNEPLSTEPAAAGPDVKESLYFDQWL